MSKSDESRVAEYISTVLKVKFEDSNFNLNGWGRVDNYAKIKDDLFLFLEVETSQKHPCTNVLKLFPYLEENIKTKIILLQVYFSDSPGLKSSRGTLSSWLGVKLQNIFSNSSFYFKAVFGTDNSMILNSIHSLIQNLIT